MPRYIPHHSIYKDDKATCMHISVLKELKRKATANELDTVDQAKVAGYLGMFIQTLNEDLREIWIDSHPVEASSIPSTRKKTLCELRQELDYALYGAK